MKQKFKKKPVVIEAEQLLPDQNIIPDGVEVYRHEDGGVSYIVKTLEGNMYATPTDWIITGVKGEKYPIKESIFYETYERVE